jgi:chromosome segregation ATPase
MPRSEKSSMKSVGYGEKSEMQDLNSILESCLGEMKQLEEDTAEFEKRIAEMEAGAAAEVRRATATIDRKNQKLKDDHRRESTDLDRLKAEAADKQREIELLIAKRDSEAAKLHDAESETDAIEQDIEHAAGQIPDLRKQLAEKRKQNAEMRKELKSLEGELSEVNGKLAKKTAEAEGLGKKVNGLKDRLGSINADGREAEQRHKFVIQRLSDILSGGPGDLDGEWQMLKDALREEHELELNTLTEEKTEKWRFELNKMDNEIAAAGARLDDANVRKGQAEMDLGAMENDRDNLLKELEGLKQQLEDEAQNEVAVPGALDDLIKAYEELLAKKEAEAKRLATANAQLEKAISKLEDTLEDLKEQVAAARLELAQEKVLYYKALENIENADGRKDAENDELEDGLKKLKDAAKAREARVKELNDEIKELRQLELDIAGLRAEIDQYSNLLDDIPDPKKKSSPSVQSNKKRRTDSGAVGLVTPAATRPAKKAKKKSEAKGKSYYKTIKGVRYDRSLLEHADELAEGGRELDEDDAEALWEDAHDGPGATDTEKATLRYVMDNYDMSEAGTTILEAHLSGEPMDEDDEEDELAAMDANDDGHVTRSEAKAYRAAKKGSKSATKAPKSAAKSAAKSGSKTAKKAGKKK